jgi:hypothetical protein
VQEWWSGRRVELELEDGLPKWRFRESDALEGCPGYHYIESGAKPHTKKEVLPTEGSWARGRELANLACMECHLVLV